MCNLTCIICPIGCSLDVEEDLRQPDNLSVAGNRCPRGVDYAREEIQDPRRTVTATCQIAGDSGSVRRAPVKTSAPCPREKILDLLHDIYKINVTLPVRAGDAVIKDWHGEGIDVIATRSINNVF